MIIKMNERCHDVPDSWTLENLRKRLKPEADIMIVNGFPAQENCPLHHQDEVVLIKRGELPGQEELEALMTARHSPGVHEKIKNAVVGIAGLGGLGSSVAVALARMGIGEMILVDYDLVEPSNLNRQQYFTDQIGIAKVQALRQNLRRINPYVKLKGVEVRVTQENIPDIFDGTDVIVEAFDSPEAKAMLCNTVLQRMPDTFFVGVSGIAGYGASDRIKITRFGERSFIVGDGIRAAEPHTGLMSPRVGVGAHHQANLVLRILLGEETFNRK